MGSEKMDLEIRDSKCCFDLDEIDTENLEPKEKEYCDDVKKKIDLLNKNSDLLKANLWLISEAKNDYSAIKRLKDDILEIFNDLRNNVINFIFTYDDYDEEFVKQIIDRKQKKYS